MTPEDTLWRIVERLEETRAILAASREGLHPEHDKELLDALGEVEQLTQTQLNICRRAQRRLEKR